MLNSNLFFRPVNPTLPFKKYKIPTLISNLFLDQLVQLFPLKNIKSQHYISNCIFGIFIVTHQMKSDDGYNSLTCTQNKQHQDIWNETKQYRKTCLFTNHNWFGTEFFMKFASFMTLFKQTNMEKLRLKWDNMRFFTLNIL
jgi:hypothetical protein